MTGRSPQRVEKGFTIIEMLVGVVIFMIGIIGFSGMTMMQAQGHRVARGSDDASTLLQSAIEGYSNVLWDDLGTDTSSPTTNGLSNGDVATEGPLNRIGQAVGTGTGPYSYYRSTVICTNSTSGVAAGANPTYCGGSVSGANRPPVLACSTLTPTPTAREKMVRVLVGWTDRNGKCHSRASSSLAFNW